MLLQLQASVLDAEEVLFKFGLKADKDLFGL
jgi:hypothetical protein